MVRNNGAVNAATAGNRVLEQLAIAAIDGDDAALPVAAILAGVINRTGTTGNTADVLPSADAIIAALPELSVGDAFEFAIRMNLAHTETLTLGTGIIAGTGTLTIAASSIRHYLLTLLSGPSRAVALACSTISTGVAAVNKVISNLPVGYVEDLSVGMGVTGTGIPASSYITAVNVTNNTVTINAEATATGDNVALSFFPRFSLSTLGTHGI